MGTVLDLDKRRAEHAKKPHKVRLDGDEWEFPNPLPIVVAQDLAMGNARAVIAATFGATASEEARAGSDDPDEAQLAADRAAARVVGRVGRLVTAEDLEQLFDELYDMRTGLGLAKRKGKEEDPEPPQD